MKWWDLILGKQCLLCGKTIDPRQDRFCEDCAAEMKEQNLEISPEEQGPILSLYRYSGCVREGLHRFKYSGCSAFGRDCGHRLGTLFLESGAAADVVTCVPRAKDGEVRLYNQSQVIARAFAETVGLPLDPKLLRKRKGARSQTECRDRRARENNAQFAYRAGPSPRDIHGLTVVLVDDLYTTGATARACVHMLKKRGAARVFVCTALQSAHFHPYLVPSGSYRHQHEALGDESAYKQRSFRANGLLVEENVKKILKLRKKP